MTEEEKKRMRDELRRKRQAENREQVAGGAKQSKGPTATTGREDTNGALNQAAGTGAEKTRPKAAGARAKAAGAAAANAQGTQTKEAFGPPVPEHLQHDAELDRQFVDGFIKARVKGPQALEAWFRTLTKPQEPDVKTPDLPEDDGISGVNEDAAQNAANLPQTPETSVAPGEAPQTPETPETIAETTEPLVTPGEAPQTPEIPTTAEPPQTPLDADVGGNGTGDTKTPEEGAALNKTLPQDGQITGLPVDETEVGFGEEAPLSEVEKQKKRYKNRKAFRRGDYSFIEDVQTREKIVGIDKALTELDQDIQSMLEEYKSASGERRKKIGNVIDKMRATRDGFMRDKAALAFPELEEKVEPIGSYEQDKLDALQSEEDALRESYQQAVEELNDQMYKTGGAGRAYWELSAQADDLFAQLNDKLTEINRKRALYEEHKPRTQETLDARSTADNAWLDLLYEREEAMSDGDEERVRELNERMAEAGYVTRWPEEVFAMIELSKGRGDDAVREILNITDGRELTDADYLKAAETNKSIWDWAIFDYFSIAENTQMNQQILSRVFVQAITDPKLSTMNTEELLDLYANAIIGENAGYDQIEGVKNFVGGMVAIPAGAVQGAIEPGNAVVYTAASLYYMACKGRYGGSITWEQMRAIDPCFDALCSTSDVVGNLKDALDVDLSKRSNGVQTLKSVSETLSTLFVVDAAGNMFGKFLSTTFANTLPAAEKLATMGSLAFQDVTFGIIEYKNSIEQALAQDIPYDQAFLSGLAGAVIGVKIKQIYNAGVVLSGVTETDAIKGLIKYLSSKGDAGKHAISILGGMGETTLGDILQSGQQKLIYDHDRPWFGDGGVVDFRQIGSDIALDSITGVAGETIRYLWDTSKPQPVDPSQKLEDIAAAAAALGNDDASPKTQEIAVGMLDTASGSTDGVEKWMRVALDDARLEDIVNETVHGTAKSARASAQEAETAALEARKAADALAASTLKASDNTDAWLNAMIQNPTDDNVDGYAQAMEELKGCLKEQASAETKAGTLETEAKNLLAAAEQKEKEAKASADKVLPGVLEVNHKIWDLQPEERQVVVALWQKNIAQYGLEEGTDRTGQALKAQDDQKIGPQYDDNSEEMMETSEENDGIIDAEEGESTFADSEQEDSEKTAGGKEAGDGKPVINEADRAKISKWSYVPSDELYLKYKAVYDDARYFDQETGAVIYPGERGDPNTDGFLNGEYEEVILKPGTIIDRYGSGSGKYFSPSGTSYEARALPPFMEGANYMKYIVKEPLRIRMGKICPWFGQPGGGVQYFAEFSAKELRDSQIIAKID